MSNYIKTAGGYKDIPISAGTNENSIQLGQGFAFGPDSVSEGNGEHQPFTMPVMKAILNISSEVDREVSPYYTEAVFSDNFDEYMLRQLGSQNIPCYLSLDNPGSWGFGTGVLICDDINSINSTRIKIDAECWDYIEPGLENTSSIYTIYIPTSGALGKASHSEGKSLSFGNNTHSEGTNTKAWNKNAHSEGNNTFAKGENSHTEGDSTSTTFTGNNGHAEGSGTKVQGPQGHAEGYKSVANANQSHAEGASTVAWTSASHAEGNKTQAVGAYSHAEGGYNLSLGSSSHTEGGSYKRFSYLGDGKSLTTVIDSADSPNTAFGDSSHAEGGYTFTTGRYSHIEGRGIRDKLSLILLGKVVCVQYTDSAKIVFYTDDEISDYKTAFWPNPNNTTTIQPVLFSSTELTSDSVSKDMIYQGNTMVEVFAARNGSTSSVNGSISGISDLCNANKCYLGNAMSVEGLCDLDSIKLYDLWLDRDPTKNIDAMYTEGDFQKGVYVYLVTNTTGIASHSEGYQSTAVGLYSHAEGFDTCARGDYSHTEGYDTFAVNSGAHSEGYHTKSSGQGAHSEGVWTAALQYGAHAEGQSEVLTEDRITYGDWVNNGYKSTIARGYGSHAEGKSTFSGGDGSHSEGVKTAAGGNASHAEGEYTYASGGYAHAEGQWTLSSGTAAHAEGCHTTASGKYSHAGGYYTTANTDYQTVIGKYNASSTALFVVGKGTSDSARSNAFEIFTNGTIKAPGATVAFEVTFEDGTTATYHLVKSEV